MNNEVLTYSLTVLFLSLLSRLAVNLKTQINSDSFGHILFSKSLSSKKIFNFFGPIKLNFVDSVALRNPLLWNKLISFIPTKFLLKWNKYFNIIIDSLITFFLFFTLISLFNVEVYIAFLTTIVYALSPLNWTNISIGPRLGSFTPRLFSELLGNFHFLLFFTAKFHNLEYSLLYLSLTSYIIFCSSKFAAQFILFVSLLYFLISFDFEVILPLLLGFSLCLLLHRKEFIKYFFYYWSFLSTYFIDLRNKKSFLNERNSLTSIKRFFNGKSGLSNLLMWNSYISLIFKFPFIIVVFLHFDSLSPECIYFLFSLSTIFLLTSLKPFLFLGEAERYFSHASIVILFLTVYSISTLAFYIIIASSFTYLFYELIKLKNEPPGHLNSIFEDLAKIESSTVCFFPTYTGGGHWRTLLFTKHRVLAPTRGPVHIDTCNEIVNKYMYYNPYYKLDEVENIFKRFAANLFVIFKPDLKRFNLNENFIPSNWKTIHVNDPDYLVIKRRES